MQYFTSLGKIVFRNYCVATSEIDFRNVVSVAAGRYGFFKLIQHARFANRKIVIRVKTWVGLTFN
jgi:hypothetical protein